MRRLARTEDEGALGGSAMGTTAAALEAALEAETAGTVADGSLLRLLRSS